MTNSKISLVFVSLLLLFALTMIVWKVLDKLSNDFVIRTISERSEELEDHSRIPDSMSVENAQ